MSTYYFYEDSEPVPFCYLTLSRMAGQLPPPYESAMTPSAYLEFSIADLAEGSTRGLVNAFGNAKRALHLAIDTLLHQYGLFTHFKKSTFPDKLGLLDSIGILPITIMENLNVERNLLEHEYDIPPKKRVAEAVDVTRLLLLATERLLETTPFEVIVGWRNPKQHIVLQLEPVSGLLNLYLLRAKGHLGKIHGRSCFTGRLRIFSGNALNPGIKISKKPWKVITLNKSQMNEWKPILAELVNVQRKQSSRKSFVEKDSAFVTVPITFPLPNLKDGSWAEIMDSFLKKEMEETEKKPEDEVASARAKDQNTTS